MFDIFNIRFNERLRYCEDSYLEVLLVDIEALCDYMPNLKTSQIVKEINTVYNDYIDNQNTDEEELDEADYYDDSDDSREIENIAIDNLFGSMQES